MSVESGAGSEIIRALESMWREIQSSHDEIPDVVLITGTAVQGKKVILGHHWANRWVVDKDGTRAAELFMAGELIGRGARAVLETMLHEAAHALAHARGIKDTSRAGNRYHNRRFATLAEELGLQRPSTPSSSLGYSQCTLPDETAQRYADVIRALDEARLAYLAAPPAKGEGTARAGKRIRCQCSCGRKLNLTPKQIGEGGFLCGKCGSEFSPIE